MEKKHRALVAPALALAAPPPPAKIQKFAKFTPSPVESIIKNIQAIK
jgi:hypothetical protein